MLLRGVRNRRRATLRKHLLRQIMSEIDLLLSDRNFLDRLRQPEEPTPVEVGAVVALTMLPMDVVVGPTAMFVDADVDVEHLIVVAAAMAATAVAEPLEVTREAMLAVAGTTPYLRDVVTVRHNCQVYWHEKY